MASLADAMQWRTMAGSRSILATMKRKTPAEHARALARYSRRSIVHYSRNFLGRYHAPGTAPGTLAVEPPPEGAPPVVPPRLSMIQFDRTAIRERTDVAAADCPSPGNVTGVLWLHVQGVPTPELLERLGATYGLHPLALEDVLTQGQRTKFEIYGDQYFVVLNRPHRTSEGELTVEQVNFFLVGNCVITIDVGPSDRFEPIRARLRGKRTLRERGADYLFYSLLDVIVDEAFPLLEDLGERLENLESAVLDQPTKELRNQIHYVKRELVLLRRAWWPQRDVINTLIRDGDELLAETTRLYLRDCYDHSIRVIDFVETYREMTSSLLDTYLSSVSQRMNDIMKVLTIIATIFMPLTFIVGIYGMNFDTASPWNLPELHWRYGYFYALGVMLVIALAMIVYFRRKRWL